MLSKKWSLIVAAAIATCGLSTISARAAGTGTQISMAWVTVGGAGNAPDTKVMVSDRTCCYGAVAYEYQIGKYDVTTAQYAVFLNAVATKSDPFVLYDPCLDDTQCYGLGSGIARTGGPGAYHYTVQPGRALYPVDYINLFDAMRFANWVNNGEGNASTETGAYTLAGGTPVPTNAANIRRNPGATTFLPSENEWYKAAYYNVKNRRYYLYPAGTDAVMQCALPSSKPNTANCGSVTGAANPTNPGLPDGGWVYNYLTRVGSYTGSPSPNGTFDQGGDVFQWTDDLTDAATDQYQAGAQIAPLSDQLVSTAGSPYSTGIGPLAVLRGTDFGDSGSYDAANNRSVDYSPDKFETYGFRLARVAA